MTILNNITTTAAIYLAAAVGVILLYFLLIYVRNPVLVKLGLRNIPRRPSQSILIVIGLALSTIIIISAFSTGDTLSSSLQRQAISAYGEIDEILAPPLLSLFISLNDSDGTTTDTGTVSQNQQQLESLTAGGLSTILTVLDGGLPGITEERYEQLRTEAAAEPLIDRVAASILFPTIIRNTTTGQGEPLGFIFAVDNEYDQNFGLNAIDGSAVEMEALQPGVGNIFGQASNLFGMAGDLAQQAGVDLQLSDVAVATAAVGAALTGAGTAALAGESIDLAEVRIPLDSIDQLGIDTTPLRDQGLTELSLEALGVTTTTLESLSEVGITTTTVNLGDLGISETLSTTLSNTFGTSVIDTTTLTQDILSALNLNTLSTEIDRVLAQFGLQLRQGDVYLNRLGAEQLDARVGDVLDVYIGPIPVPFRVKAIVDEAGPLGALFPVVMLRLDEAQQLLFMNGKVNNVLVSNLGDELEGLEHTEEVSSRLRVLAMNEEALERVVAVLRRPAVQPRIIAETNDFVRDLNEDFEGPQLISDLIQTVTPVGGMIEAARDLPAALETEGISPRLREIIANTTFRAMLVSVNIPEADQAELNAALGDLNTFDVIDPLNKSTLLTVGTVGGSVFTSIFSLFGFFSVLAGILLIFLIFVMLATERRSEMGMARAIGVQRGNLVQMFLVEGMIYDLLAAAIGVLIGLGVTYAMVGFLGDIFNNLTNQIATSQSTIFTFQFGAAPTSIVIGYCIGVLFTFIVVTIAAWRVSRLNIVSAIRDLPVEAVDAQRSWINRIWRWGIGLILAAAGAWILQQGWQAELPGVLLVGATFLLIGVMLFAQRVLELTPIRNERIHRVVYTIIGLGLLLFWVVPWTTILPRYTEFALVQPSPDQTLFTLALGGPLIILGAIMAITFNADALTWVVGFVLGGVGRLTPVLKTAIAYPLNARFRTGMAMLMFAMIISSVVVMAVVIRATQSIVVLDDKETAGFEIRADSTLLSFFAPIRDFANAVANQAASGEYPLLEDVTAVGSIATQEMLVKEPADPRWSFSDIVAVDNGYLQQAESTYSFRQRAAEFADDAAVWQALRERDDVAIVTPSLVRTTDDGGRTFPFNGGGPPPDRQPRGDVNYGPFWVEAGVAADEPLPALFLDLEADTGEFFANENAMPRRVQIIGVLDDNTTLAGEEIQINLQTLQAINGTVVQPSRYYVKVAEGADVRLVAQEVERAFIGNGLNSVVLAESFAQGQAFTRGILRLLQGFMALGLLVGIAALGVITSRTVVERRQQVGVLRAIGYQPNMIALSFVLEASFIAITGLIIGAVTGIVLGESLVRAFFDSLTPETVFPLPWLQIGLILVGSYIFALLTTIVPAYQAARVYPAEALRYEG